MTEMHQVTKLL